MSNAKGQDQQVINDHIQVFNECENTSQLYGRVVLFLNDDTEDHNGRSFEESADNFRSRGFVNHAKIMDAAVARRRELEA